MNKTKIEWTDYTWNPLTGCSRHCKYCYAQRMAFRLKGRCGYPSDDPFKVTFHPERLSEPQAIKKPAKIFTCSMGELYDKCSTYTWIGMIYAEMKRNPQHIFQSLTKCGEVLPQFNLQFPDNLWQGVSITNQEFVNSQLEGLYDCEAKVKFASFEPLLGRVRPDLEGVDWIIIGRQTGPNAIKPKKEWIEELVQLGRANGCAIFIKNNLMGLHEIIQEFPASYGQKEMPK
jgi:protein gp37